MAAEIKIYLDQNGQCVRLVAVGRVDIHTADVFRAAVENATRRHRRVLVDLTGVRFLGDDGAAALEGHIDRVAAILVGLDSPIAGTLRAAGLRSSGSGPNS
jgi:anti-anti-sigma regulatory factor